MTNLYDPRLDPHCGRAGCHCDHSGDCYRGWIELTDEDTGYFVVACSVCDSGKRRRTQMAKDRDEMGRNLRASSVHQQWTGAAS